MAKKPDLKPILKAVNPEEAIAYFRQKDYRIGFDYRDVWQQEHQAGFTVAKAMQLDLLQDIRAAVDKALSNGTTLTTFQKELTPLLQKRGWWGKQERVDPADEEAKLVQLGSPRRLEVIFDTNLATAYSEGQWERIQRNQQLFPFLEYVRSASVNPRHTHLAYAGLVLPATDPFWQSHLPIKEWGCKCTVVQHSRRMLEREGLTVGEAPPEVMRTVVNKRTGEVMQVPTGVDPAFHYRPGGRRAHLEKMLADKQGVVNAASTSQAAVTAAKNMQGIAGKKVVHALGPVTAVAQVQSATGFNLAGYTAVFDNSGVRHTMNNHGNAKAEQARGQVALRIEDFAHIDLILSEPDAVYARGRSFQNVETVAFTKLIAGEGYWLLQEVRPGRKLLALKSMWKKKGAWREDDLPK
jgi:hypothetical protein